jgi:hypothetical protein
MLLTAVATTTPQFQGDTWMSILQVYAAIRVGRTPDAPQWDDLSKPMQELIEAIFNLGILTAAEYVGGNWSDTKTMATHLRAVANGEAKMFAE